MCCLYLYVYAHSMRFPSRNNLTVDTLTDGTMRCYSVAGCRGLVSDCQTALMIERGGQTDRGGGDLSTARSIGFGESLDVGSSTKRRKSMRQITSAREGLASSRPSAPQRPSRI